MISKHSPGGKQAKKKAARQEAGAEPRGSGPGGVKFFVQINLLFARNLSKCFSISFSAPTEQPSYTPSLSRFVFAKLIMKRDVDYLLLSLAKDNDDNLSCIGTRPRKNSPAVKKTLFCR